MTPVRYLETAVLHCGDTLNVLDQFPDECVDLIYLDPPFFSNRHYEVVWGDEAEVRSFQDRWKGGVQHYLGWMERRFVDMYRVLKPTGSLYLHCDPHASHHLKIMCDAFFGPGGFRSEIVWKRSSAHNDARQGRRQFGDIHDTILFYTKGTTWTWNPIYVPYDEAYVASKYRYREPGTGRLYRLDNLTGPGGAAKGNPEYELLGVRRHWRYSKERMEQLLAEGRIVQTKPGRVPQYKRYLDEMPGVPLQDVWTDLDPVNSRARERLGYPTQKPEALLERIIRASSNRGDVVLDPFCGCGTTIAVAQKMGRDWIGVDISPMAVEIMKRRVSELGAVVTDRGMPKSLDDIRAMGPREFQKWIIERVGGHQQARHSGDMGIDGFEFFERLPIQVKQSEKVGRNVVDNFETAIERAGKHKGYMVAYSFGRGAIEEAARVRRAGGVEVVLVKAEDVVRLGALIDSAAREYRQPDVQGESPDVMGLFKQLRQAVEHKTDRPRTRARVPAQQQLPLG